MNINRNVRDGKVLHFKCTHMHNELILAFVCYTKEYSWILCYDVLKS